MDRPFRQMSLAGSQLGAVRHVCAFFTNDDEEFRVLLPFIKEGLSSGDRAVYIINPEQREEHLHRLAAEGIDTSVHRKSGQFEIQNNTEVYLQEGVFDQARMLKVFEAVASVENRPGGFARNRIVCRMDWASSDPSRMEDVIEFESRVNDVWTRSDDAVICTYHLPSLSGAAVIDIMRTHPIVIIGAHLQLNPFFTPPEEFLREFRTRRAGRTSPL